MQKLLIIHTKYRDRGGEDVAVENEVELLKKHFNVKTIYFSNEIENYFTQAIAFILNRNIKSDRKIINEIDSFDPDYIYIHNTWFKGSLGIFKIVNRYKIKTFLKIHNFRYDCTKSFFSKNHFLNDKICKACGLNSDSVGIFNKYFNFSFLRSLLVNYYGKKYFKILKDTDIKLLVLTDFHKKYLIDLNIPFEKIEIFSNFLPMKDLKINNTNEKFIVYAGRISEEKGVEELIKSFLKTNLHGLKLKLIGSGPMLKYLKDKYDDPRILYIGEIDNSEALKHIAESAAVVTATKLYEGQPTLLCEASSIGIPSIFPKSGGIEEFFPKNYKLSFDQFNYHSLEKKLQLILNQELMIKTGEENKVYISKYLSEDALVSKFRRILNE